jgi:hypothetical protein
MNRREAVSRVALLLGGTLSLPTLMALQRSDCSPLPGSTGFQLTSIQQKLVAEVAEMIIPKTDTPGAIEAGVPSFIEMMLADCYEQPEHLSFREGVDALIRSGFLDQSPMQRTATLEQLQADTKIRMAAYNIQQSKMGDNEDRELMNTQKMGLPYWRLMKELTLLGYFTSEAGIMGSFEYVPVPGKFEVVKLKPNQKAFAY